MRTNSTTNGNGNDIAIGTTSHVWVRTELVEALVKYNGNLSPGWKLSTSRKRARTVSTMSSNHNNHHQTHNNHNNSLHQNRTEVQEAWVWLRARMAPISTKEYGSPPPSPARRSSLSGSSRSPRMSSGSPRMAPGSPRIAPGSPFSNRRHDKLKKLQYNRRTTRGGDNNSTGSDEPATKKHGRSCTITVDDDEYSPFQLQHVTVTVPSELTADPNLFCMANTWWQQPEATPPDDLTLLTHLHEPSVVYCLQRRYEQNVIYTYTGKILIALNPFYSIPRIYDESIMQQYWIRGSSQLVELPPLPPHVFAVAQDAYGSMIRELQEQQHRCQQQQQQKQHQQHRGNMALGKENQSILVSGESGAGKTVTTKIIMRYLATLSKQVQSKEKQKGNNGAAADASIESQVLQSNPILESFGNARTIRNDNSSRFGKFIEIQFLSSGCLVSAAITTYLLEKVRLISQAPGERNYHVFYELMAGVSHQERRTLGLGNASPSSFRMTAVSGTFDRRDGVEDRENYRLLRSAMDTVGFTKLEQNDLLSVACALLHASNLTFRETSSDLVELDPSNPSLQPTLSLLGVTSTALNNALCLCAIEAAGETVHKRLSVSQASKALEALMKATYGALFDHIVSRINNSITIRQKLDDASIMKATPQLRSASIGVLDIFGFESFETNSYEQLCINYCNEALQQQFNRFVFKLEQEEYAREGIEWSFISFPDNQDVLDLVEAKHEGILSLLDEQCRLQRCTDASFARAVYEKCHKHPRFEATNAQKVNARFSIHHYAGLVEYDTANFLEKNKDELPKETTELLMSSSHALLSRLGKSLKELPTRSKSPLPQRDDGGKKQFHRASSSILRESVGSQFSSQLRELRTRIELTTPHYVRCIKPNDDLIPHNFNPLIIADQLRCAGVLEAVRVSRIGFPQRYPHASFLERYKILALHNLKQYNRQAKGRGLCEVLLNLIVPRVLEILDDESMQEYGSMLISRGKSTTFLGIQIGVSKIFLRQKAFDALETLRSRKLDQAAIIVQAYVRRFLAMQFLVRSLMAILILQSFVRKFRAVQQVRNMRRNISATIIQTTWRRFQAEKTFVAALLIALWCQSAQRRWVAKQLSAIMKIERVAVVIQRSWRRYRQIGFFTRAKSAAVRIQCSYRIGMAKRQFLAMRQQARDLRVVAAERDLFRNEALRLRNELNQLRNASRIESSPASSVVLDDTEVTRLKSEIDKLKQELALFQHHESPPPVSPQEQRSVAAVGPQIPTVSPMVTHASLGAFVSAGHLSPYEVLPKQIASPLDNQNPRPKKKSSPGKVSTFHSPSKLSGLTAMFNFSFGRFAPSKSPRNDSIASPSKSISSKSLLDSENDEIGGMLVAMNVSPMNFDTTDSSFHGNRRFESFDRTLKRNDSRDSTFRVHFDALCNTVMNSTTHELEDLLRRAPEPHVLVNECDDRGRTALHLAAQGGNIKISKLLLEHGAIVNSQDDEGETPLHLSSSASMMMFLLEEGIGANANIPNVDGVCLLHLAVQRRDIESVRGLLRHSADVNSADNIRWFTPLHLVALPARNAAGDDISEDTDDARDVRVRIAQLLCGATNAIDPDLNYQDIEGNTPLHYAVQIISEEARDIVDVFLEKGADPKVTNNRGQSPLHLLLHNEFLRRLEMTQQMLHLLLYHGADPNQQSMTGCTGLHLTLYHKDIDGAVQLMNAGAELHLVWKKPRHWATFWNDHGMSEVLALDMVEDDASLHRLLAAITKQQQWAPPRPWCMNCQLSFGPFGRTLHCRHCGRLVCGSCTRRTLGAECFPKSFEIYEASWVCIVCDKILVARKEDESNGTQPISSIEDDEEDRSFF